MSMTHNKTKPIKSNEELAYEIDMETEALRIGALEQVKFLTDIRADRRTSRNRLFAIRNACRYGRMLAVNTWLSFED
jgi:hypothetical protein